MCVCGCARMHTSVCRYKFSHISLLGPSRCFVYFIIVRRSLLFQRKESLGQKAQVLVTCFSQLVLILAYFYVADR